MPAPLVLPAPSPPAPTTTQGSTFTHNHPSDASTTAGPQRSRHPLSHRSTPKPQGHPTPPPLQDRTSHRIVGHPGHAPPTTRHPHPQNGRPMVGPPLGTRSPHGGPGLYPGNRPRRRPRGWQRLLQATTLTGRKGTPWEALHTALYWAQGSPNGPDTPEPTGAWVMQAKAMKNHHLHHPFDDSPAPLPWPSDPPETVRKLADLMRSHAKASMQTPAEPPLRDPGQQATHHFFFFFLYKHKAKVQESTSNLRKGEPIIQK